MFIGHLLEPIFTLSLHTLLYVVLSLSKANGIKIGPQHSPSGAGLAGNQGAAGGQGGGCC